MKRLLWLAMIGLGMVGTAAAQTDALQGWCQTGGKTVATQGLQSVTTVQQSYPKCLVTVYLTGTLTKATLFKDQLSTPLANPFTSNTDGSWLFFANDNTGYDVTMTSGTAPNVFPIPFTLTDLKVGTGSGSGCVPSGANGSFLVKSGSSCPTGLIDQDASQVGAITAHEAVSLIGASGAAGQIGFVPGTLPGDLGNAISFIAPSSITPYRIQLPPAHPTSGNPLLSCTGANPAVCTWGSSSLTVEVDGTPLITPNPVNFQDSASVLFSNPSAGNIQATVNFTGGLQMQPALPSQAQHIVLYPSTVNGSSGAPVFAFPPDSIASTPYCLFGGAATLQATGFALPSYINPANVTAVYAFAFAQSTAGSGSLTCFGTPADPHAFVMTPFNMTGTGISPAGFSSPVGNPDTTFGLQQVTTGLTGLSGANIPSAAITATANISLGFSLGSSFYMPSEGLIVYYTGPPPPATTAINVIPPLKFTNGSLSIDELFAFPGSYAHPYTVAQALAAMSTMLANAKLWVYDATGTVGSPNCMVGGGTIKTDCIFDGSHTLTAYGGGGGGSGTIATTPLVLKGDNAGNAVPSTISNPTCVGCAGGVGLPQGTLVPNATTAVTLTVPSSVTSYRLQLPGTQPPDSSHTFPSCTNADPSVCTWATGGSSPLTTKGDIFGHSTVDARIPVGSNGQVLTADSTAAVGVSWQAGGGSSGSLINNLLVNSPTTAPFFCETDSLSLPWTGSFCLTLANNLSIPSGEQNIATIGSASLPDMLSCNTAGAGNCTQVGTWPLTFPLGVVSNSKALLEAAYNDLSNMGSAPTNNQLSYYYGGLKAWALEFGIPDSLKLTANGSACTTTGTWTAATSVPGHGTFPTGTLQSSTPGSTISCTAPTATNAGFIGLKTTGSTTATYTVSVTQPGDPSAPYSVADPYTSSTTLNQTAYYTTAWGGISNLYAIGQSGMAGGFTTVTLTTASNGSDPVYVVGPYFLSQSTSLQNAPAVEIMLESRACGNGTCSTVSGAQHNDTNTNAMRKAQTAVANELRSNGLNISYFDPNAPTVGYDPKNLNQNSFVSQFTVTAGGSGYTTAPTPVWSGCTVAPTGIVTISGGAVVTGTFTTLTSGNCNGGTPTVALTGGGGSGATATSGAVNSDGTHPNFVGGTNIANAATNALNSAATTADHFLPSVAVSGGSGCTVNCTITTASGSPALTLTGPQDLLDLNSTSTIGSQITMHGSGSGVHNWTLISGGTGLGGASGGNFFLGDLTSGIFSWKQSVNGAGVGYIENPAQVGNCWSSSVDVTSTACDTGFSRESGRIIDAGNGTQGDFSADVKMENLISANPASGSHVVWAGVSPSSIGAFTFHDITDSNFPLVIRSDSTSQQQGLEIPSGGTYQFDSTTTGGGTTDTMLSRPSAGTVSFDTTTAGNHLANATLNNLTINGTCTGCGGTGFITSITNVGSSGAATVTSGVLNVPIYAGGGSGDYVSLLPSVTAAGCTVSGHVCTVGTAASTISFSGIPGTYQDLKLKCTGTVTNAATNTNDPVNINFNGDSTSGHYISTSYMQTGGGTAFTASFSPSIGAQTTMFIAGLGTTGNAPIPGSFETTIFGYANTTFDKNVMSKYGVFNTNLSGDLSQTYTYGLYEQTTAITSLSLASDHTFAVGTVCTLAGEN